MATITKSYAENQRGGAYPSATLATHTIAITKTSNNIYMGNGSTFKFGSATAAFKYNTSADGRNALSDLLSIQYQAGTIVSPVTCNFDTGLARVSANTNVNVTASISDSYAYNTASFFNSNNSTAISVPFSMRVSSYSLTTGVFDSQGAITVVGYHDPTTVSDTWTKICDIVLNAPPTFTTTQVSTDTNYIYAGLTTASVTISSLSAKFGGTIASATLKIGEQTATRTTNGTLSILLDTVGTFTPTVTVTDSRGQTTTETLTAITVNGYTAPSVSFDAERTTQAGIPDDEGGYATLEATFTFADVVATLLAPSVTMTDENGTQTTPTVTWYSTRASDGTLSGTVDWSTMSYGDTAYCLVAGLNTNYSYQISVRPRDDKGTGTAITQTVAGAFYTVDFLAGGHGIAFGKPASNVGFECAMDATFDETLTAQDMTQQEVDDFVDSLVIGR